MNNNITELSPQQLSERQAPSVKPTLSEVDIALIDPGTFQTRTDFGGTSLDDLAKSIEERGGVIEPVVLRPRPGGRRFELIAGERRWRATQKTSLTSILALIGEYADEDAAYMCLTENLFRKDLNAIEEAEGYQNMSHEFGHTHAEIADRLGIKRSSVSNKLRLLNLPFEVQNHVRNEALSWSLARELLSVKESFRQTMLAEKAIYNKWSKEELLACIKSEAKTLNLEFKSNTNEPRKSLYVRKVEEAIAETGYPAKIQENINKKGKGKLIFQYNSYDELQGILDRLGVDTDSEIENPK